MTTPKAAMEQALRALNDTHTLPGNAQYSAEAAAISALLAALRAALAETAEPRLTVDALRVEFERRYIGKLGITRVGKGEYFSPAIETEWQQFVRQYTAPQLPAPAVECDCDNLPPLPETNTVPRDYFTADQMREFARAAIAAHEAKRGKA